MYVCDMYNVHIYMRVCTYNMLEALKYDQLLCSR